MDKFNANNFNINKFNPQLSNINKHNLSKGTQGNGFNLSFAKNLIPKFNLQRGFNYSGLASLRMNNFELTEKNVYLKNLMNLPKDLKDVLALVQKTSQGVTAKNLSNIMSSNINLSVLAEIMKNNGKEAMSKLISVMADVSKRGISQSSELKDAMKLINASVSVSGQESQTQALKNFMLLYLPWLPLQEGKDFDLEVEASESSGADDDVVLTILISTKNYGNIRILVILKELNSFDIFVLCGKKFPQKQLSELIKTENKKHSLQTNISFEEKEEKTESEKTHQAKVNISNLQEVNPYMLMLANSLIRIVIELDNTVA